EQAERNIVRHFAANMVNGSPCILVKRTNIREPVFLAAADAATFTIQRIEGDPQVGECITY
ncbi:hypothetical protein WAJ13_22315, partial [Acinetobacter baumannii]